jgi:hypothetical protein
VKLALSWMAAVLPVQREALDRRGQLLAGTAMGQCQAMVPHTELPVNTEMSRHWVLQNVGLLFVSAQKVAKLALWLVP